MNKPESVVKKHFDFISNFVNFLIQRNIQIVEYRYQGYAFGSWYFDIAYKEQFRRFIYDGRDASLLVVDNKDRRFPNLDDCKKVSYQVLTDDERNDLLTIIKSFVE